MDGFAQWLNDIYTKLSETYNRFSSFVDWILNGGFWTSFLLWVSTLFPDACIPGNPAPCNGWSQTFASWSALTTEPLTYFFHYLVLGSYFVNLHLALQFFIAGLMLESILATPYLVEWLKRIIPMA